MMTLAHHSPLRAAALRHTDPAIATERHLRMLPPLKVQQAATSLMLEDVRPGRAIFSSTVAAEALDGEAERLCRILARFAAETAVQSSLQAGAGFRPLGFRLNLLRHDAPPPVGRLEATADLISHGSRVLRASATVRDAAGVERVRATFVAMSA